MAQQLKRVLIVNDDSAQRGRIQAIVEGLCDVTAPDTLNESLACLTEVRDDSSAFDLVILDHLFEFWAPREPPRTGQEVLQMWLRAAGSRCRTPVLVVTNFPNEDLLAGVARPEGVYIEHFGDLSPERLYQAVESLLGLV